MSRLETLPPEIRLRVYEFVFQGTLVHPNPIMWARQPSCDAKSKFERLQADWPHPVGLFMVSKFFNTDPLTERAFYTKATFCFGVSWQWPAFVSFAREKAGDKAGNATDPARLITSVMDTTPKYTLQSHLNFDRVTIETLPNLKHVYFGLFSGYSNSAGRVISKVYGYETFNQLDCEGCELGYVTHDYDLWEGHEYCGYHRAPTPDRFALPRSDILIGQKTSWNGRMYCYSPSDFILSGFFNNDFPDPEYHRPLDEMMGWNQDYELKEKIMNGLVTMQVSCDLLFDTDIFQDEPIEVTSHFSSSDWILRYNWNGKAYEVQQTKPQSFDSKTKRFLP